ncbi:MAG: sulfite exporter TauE/SafE family protein [Pseudomonadota bacterium]
MLTEEILWLAPFVFILAGTVKGAIGIGLPTTVIAFLSLVTDPRVAVAVGLLSMVLSNIWQVYREGDVVRTLRRFWPMASVTMVVLFCASFFAAAADGRVILICTGIAIAIFAATSLVGQPPALPPPWERAGQIVSGTASGLMGGFTGIWAPPLLIFLLSLRLEKTDFVRTIGFLLLLGALPLLAGYVVTGLMTKELFAMSVAMLIPTFLGFTIGERIRRALNPARFQKSVLIFFLIMGLNMIRQAVWG